MLASHRTRILALVSIVTAAAHAPRPQSATAQGYAPEEAVGRAVVAPGLKLSLFASEPEVRQPIFVKCDDRGRLWTIQYLQYPNPAGLERVKVDRWSRTEYDRVPEPPPKGPRGADRITILEDLDRDGRADRFTDFVDGLNLVTGVEFGHGGVYVLNVPYLLFYPDANRDDVPDADPEVLLTGFGMEDAQAMSNHLTWGPDGWLYGVNGSTTTCRIRGIEFQQGLWRFHPVTREFELFCEGGSNCYGVAFDANGECYYSTNGGPFVHAVQGGYYYKSFGKHGPLHNLYAYHFFPELERDNVPGGPPTGGTMYLADAFPARLRNTFIAGNFLGHTVSAWDVAPKGSTVTAKFRETIFDAHDPWCGPTDVCLAPDGTLYVSDFFDQRTAHPDPDANWDRTNGRIYKISGDGVASPGPLDVTRLSSDALVDLLSHSNHWYSNRARVELAHRRDSSIVPRLRSMALQSADPRQALEGLWALHGAADVDDELALQLLDHPHDRVRAWTVRLIGDRRDASSVLVDRIVKLALQDASPIVQSQLAATARRLPAEKCLAVIDAQLRAHPEESDERIPWLIWWAVESKSMSDASAVVRMFSKPEAWANPAARDNALRLIRRYAADGTDAGYDACLALLQSAPARDSDEALQQLRLGLSERSVGLQGIGQGALFGQQAAGGDGNPNTAVRQFVPATPPLTAYVERRWRADPQSLLALELALRTNVQGASEALQAGVTDGRQDADRLVALLRLYRELGHHQADTSLLDYLASDLPEPVQLAALDALASADAGTAIKLLDKYAAASPPVKSRIRDIAVATPQLARAFLKLVDSGQVQPADVPIEQVSRLALHNDDQINQIVRQHWGNIGPGSPEEKLATMRRYNNDLRPGGGDPGRGKEMFAKHCATCHQLFGEGNKIGPDLTTANRQDVAALLGNIVDPSAVIRREYMSYVVETDSGQAHSGVMVEQDAASVTLVNAQNQRIKIPRNEIAELREADVSLMPERILDALTPQELRDLFSYLQGGSQP